MWPEPGMSLPHPSAYHSGTPWGFVFRSRTRKAFPRNLHLLWAYPEPEISQQEPEILLQSSSNTQTHTHRHNHK